MVVDEAPEGVPAARPAAAAGRLRPRLRAGGDRRDRRRLRERAGLPKEPTGVVASSPDGRANGGGTAATRPKAGKKAAKKTARKTAARRS